MLLVAGACGCNYFPDHRVVVDAGSDAALDAPDGPTPPRSVVALWTLKRNDVAATCDQLAGAPLEVAVRFSQLAQDVVQGESPCAALELGLSVPEGDYDVAVLLAPVGAPAVQAVRYHAQTLTVDREGIGMPFVLAQADVSWSWTASNFSGCVGDAAATLRLLFDGAEVASAPCADEQVAGVAPVGARDVTVAIAGTAPSQHVVSINVPLAGGVVELAP